MKAMIAHLEGDDMFDMVFYVDHYTNTRIVRLWILAGQMKLYKVQNQLLEACVQEYIKLKNEIHITPEVLPFEVIHEAFGEEYLDSKITLFMIH